MAYEQYSAEKNMLLAKRYNISYRDAYTRKTIGFIGSESAAGPSMKLLEEIKRSGQEETYRFGFAELKKLINNALKKPLI